MTGLFSPRLDILPIAQRSLWPQLHAAVSLGFVLYGGTAIALRLGHRQSVDFDFFCTDTLDHHGIRRAFPFLAHATVLQDRPNALTVQVAADQPVHAPVKVSFFGTIAFGRVGKPEMTDDGVLLVASLDDLMASKLKVILQRSESKDYRDIAAMLGAHVSLSRGLANARLMFQPTFQPSESLRALSFFGDGDLHLVSDGEKRILVKAATGVRDLPDAVLSGAGLVPGPEDPR